MTGLKCPGPRQCFPLSLGQSRDSSKTTLHCHKMDQLKLNFSFGHYLATWYLTQSKQMNSHHSQQMHTINIYAEIHSCTFLMEFIWSSFLITTFGTKLPRWLSSSRRGFCFCPIELNEHPSDQLLGLFCRKASHYDVRHLSGAGESRCMQIQWMENTNRRIIESIFL